MKKLLIGLLMVPVMAHAEFKTGNELFADIDSQSAFNRGLALGFLMGTFDTGRSVYFCPPADGGGINAGQIQDIVRQYFARNPQIRNFPAYLLVMDAMKEIWPCAPKGKGV